MATWITTYGSGTNMGRPGVADLDHLALLYVAQQGTNNYTILGLPDSPAAWYDLSPRSAPYTSQADAAAAAATLFDVSGWVPIYGAFGARYPGWLNPALVASVEAAPVNGGSSAGGFYLSAQVSFLGSVYDVSDRATPFATEADAVTAIGTLFGDGEPPPAQTPYAPISMTVQGGQLTARGRNLVVGPGNGNFRYGYVLADQMPVAVADSSDPLGGRINCKLAWNEPAILPWNDPRYRIQVDITVVPATPTP